MDKEYDIDPVFLGAIKDADTEKKFRELYEKAVGIDSVKSRLQEAKKTLGETNAELSQFRDGVNTLRECYARNDFDSFFQHLQIPQEKVLQWVLKKVELSQLPPEQRQVHDAQYTAERKAYDAERRVQHLEQMFQEQSSNAKRYALQVALERPDVKTFAEDFDSRAGRPGAFRDAVCEHGEYTWHRSQGKIDLDPGQAALEVMQRYQQFMQPGANGGQASAPNASPGTGAPQKEVPVIPNLGGRSASPTKAKPKTLEDIKKLAASM